MRGYSAVGLFTPKTGPNVGAVLRACTCFDSSLIVIEGARYKRQVTDTYGTTKHTPLIHAPLRQSIPFDCVPVAVELLADATPLPEYEHPERAFYVFGPEDGTLGANVTGWCRDVIQIPTPRCLNLAATVNVVLYDRLAKQSS